MVRIKICGLRRPEDVQAVNQYRPDLCGFIFAKGRRRYVEPETAAGLQKMLDPSVKSVGVFVDSPAEEILETARLVGMNMIQLHGQEGEDMVRELKARTGLPVIKAFSVSSAEDLRKASESCADLILLDSGKGGTGEMFDWSLLRQMERPFILAGGLSPENLENAVRRIRPYAVDISSGVETDGWKDPGKIGACVDIIRRMNEE